MPVCGVCSFGVSGDQRGDTADGAALFPVCAVWAAPDGVGGVNAPERAIGGGRQEG